jgi:CheY-like chemotaxis protein
MAAETRDSRIPSIIDSSFRGSPLGEANVNVKLESPIAPRTGAVNGNLATVKDNPVANSLYCPTEVRILVIDDEPGICQLIRSALERPNFLLDTVSDVTLIEHQLQTKPYHLIISDYVLPGVNPQDLFDWLKRDQADASVIVVTGFPSLDSVVSCLRARTYDYLTKPFDISQLEDVVRRCLEAKGLLRLSEEALRETLGNTIRERRKALSLTLAQMADRTGVSLGYLSQIELGKNSASIETLYRICLGLGIKMGELFQTIKS